MVTMEVFLMLLLVVSIFTSLAVEAVKKIAGEKYNASSNIVAGIIAIVLGLAVGIFYCVMAQIAFTTQIVVVLIALVFLSWLCAMIGYDKVIQAINQVKGKVNL